MDWLANGLDKKLLSGSASSHGQENVIGQGPSRQGEFCQDQKELLSAESLPLQALSTSADFPGGCGTSVAGDDNSQAKSVAGAEQVESAADQDLAEAAVSEHSDVPEPVERLQTSVIGRMAHYTESQQVDDTIDHFLFRSFCLGEWKKFSGHSFDKFKEWWYANYFNKSGFAIRDKAVAHVSLSTVTATPRKVRQRQRHTVPPVEEHALAQAVVPVQEQWMSNWAMTWICPVCGWEFIETFIKYKDQWPGQRVFKHHNWMNQGKPFTFCNLQL